MKIPSLTWERVNAWRLSQQFLSARLKRRNLVHAVARMGGVQAQVMSAAELAIWARVENPGRDDIRTALWQDRTLVKTWAMRGTLHLLAAEELPLYVAARSVLDNRNWENYFTYYGITPARHRALLAAVPEVLGDQPMTREELATAIGKQTRVPKLRDLILSSGWGSPLKPSAFRGELVFGPNRGPNVTFVNPAKWLGTWKTVEPEQALEKITRLYLQTYGPATPKEFAKWWWGGGGVTQAQRLFQSLGEEITEVEVEGWRAFALRSTLEPMAKLETAKTVQLLPLFDSYTFGQGRDIEALLPNAFKRRVFRQAGWISAVVLVNGFVKGVWQYATTRGKTTVSVGLFSAPNAFIREGIQVEAERLGAFLGTDASVVYT